MTKRKYRVCGYDGNGHPIYVGRGIKAQVRKPRIPRKLKKALRHIVRVVQAPDFNGISAKRNSEIRFAMTLPPAYYHTSDGYPKTSWVHRAIFGLIREEKRISDAMTNAWKDSMMDSVMKKVFEHRLIGIDPALPGGYRASSQVWAPPDTRKFYQPIKLPLEFKPILILPDLNIEELLKKIQTK